MSGEDKVCQLGKLIAESQSEIRIEPQSNAVQPIGLEVNGNVNLFWGQETTAVHLLPGDYTAFAEFSIPSHITECRLNSGEYDFCVLNITPPQAGEIQLTQSDEGNVLLRGQTVITGHGICQNTIDFLQLEHLLLNATLRFTSEQMQVDHPVVLGGNITGTGSLILLGTQPFPLNGDSLDVGELHVVDGDASIVVPTSGYQSLTLEAKNRDSRFALHGEYHIDDFTLMTDAHTLTLEAGHATSIYCTGSVATSCSGNGSIRWHGDGSETWVLEDNAVQTLDMTFEHGHHVLGTVINSKTGGSITVASPLCVVDYRKPDGTSLPALANLTVLSKQSLQGELFLVVNGTGECVSGEGVKLQRVTIISGGTVAFYAKLTDLEEQPLRPELVEQIRLDCHVMNPLAPYLHEPRRTVLNRLNLEIPRVLSSVWRADENRLPQGQTFNFHLDSAMLRELQFDEPGLYYVTLTVKLFGHKNAVPFRYEIHCERPVIAKSEPSA